MLSRFDQFVLKFADYNLVVNQRLVGEQFCGLKVTHATAERYSDNSITSVSDDPTDQVYDTASKAYKASIHCVIPGLPLGGKILVSVTTQPTSSRYDFPKSTVANTASASTYVITSEMTSVWIDLVLDTSKISPEWDITSSPAGNWFEKRSSGSFEKYVGPDALLHELRRNQAEHDKLEPLFVDKGTSVELNLAYRKTSYIERLVKNVIVTMPARTNNKTNFSTIAQELKHLILLGNIMNASIVK